MENKNDNLDLFKINRRLKFQTEYKKIRKLKINKENLHEDIRDDKIRIERPWKTLQFENISDNFYLNILDIHDSGKMALGTKSGVAIYDINKSQSDQNFEVFNHDSASETYSVKLMYKFLTQKPKPSHLRRF
jgi:hypothetical protein